jgi:peptide/nickel transport system permease protein
MKDTIHKLGARLLMLTVLTLLGGLLGATLVRFAPGYGVDERELDPRLNHASVDSIRNARQIDSGLLSYYGRYLAGAAHLDLGTSQWLGRPVSLLIKERLPITLRSVLLGILVAWAVAFATSLAGLLFPGFFLEITGTAASSLLIALPTAVVAMLAVHLREPVFVAIAVVTFPKLFRYLRNLLRHAHAQPHILAARARGISRGRIIFCHVLPLVTPALAALAGVSLSMAFGAAIPIEALCDSPGVGQLAWQAALNRDLPLIVNLTLVITLITVGVNSLASVAHERTQ